MGRREEKESGGRRRHCWAGPGWWLLVLLRAWPIMCIWSGNLEYFDLFRNTLQTHLLIDYTYTLTHMNTHHILISISERILLPWTSQLSTGMKNWLAYHEIEEVTMDSLLSMLGIWWSWLWNKLLYHAVEERFKEKEAISFENKFRANVGGWFFYLHKNTKLWDWRK